MKISLGWKIFLVFLGFGLLGCSSDPGSSSRSTLRLKMPSAFEKGSSVGALSQSSCFAISVRGENLPEVAASDCDPSYGEFRGLVKAGETVEMELNQGKDRTIDIFYVSVANGCSEFDPSLGLGATFGSNKVFRVSHHEGIDMSQAEVQVVVEVDFPKVSNSLGQLFSSSNFCEVQAPILAVVAPPGRSLVGSRREVMSDGRTLSVRVGAQKTNVQQQSNFSGRVTPYKLGVSQ